MSKCDESPRKFPNVGWMGPAVYFSLLRAQKFCIKKLMHEKDIQYYIFFVVERMFICKKFNAKEFTTKGQFGSRVLKVTAGRGDSKI